MSSTMADRMTSHLKAIRKESNEKIAEAKKDGRLSYGFTRLGRLYHITKYKEGPNYWLSLPL